MKVKKEILVLSVLMVMILSAGVRPTYGQSVNLTISPTTISFSAADPDLVPLINADFPVHVTIVVSGTTRSWQLILHANGDLAGGGQTIPISNVSWTATSSPPFQNGTLVNNVDQRAASGTGVANQQGDLNFMFMNLWTYRARSYSQTVRFTLALI
jgi:hypothetical protein